MFEKRTMTLNLSVQEMEVVERLAEEKGLSKTALLRQALRLYQSISKRLDDGEKVFVEHPTTKEKAELMVWAAEAEWVGAERSISCRLAMK